MKAARSEQKRTLRRLPRALPLVAALMIAGAAVATAQNGDIEALEQRYDELYAGGDIAGALVQAQRIEAAVKKRVGSNHHDYAVALERLAAVYVRQGRNREAEAALLRALPILEKAPGSNQMDLASALANLAVVYAWSNEPELAFQQLELLSKLPYGIFYSDLKLAPYFEPLRKDPRFDRLLAQLAPHE